MEKKTLDAQIVAMRFMAIILILFHHSTIVFSGWPPSDVAGLGLPHYIAAASLLAKLYGLGLFTFISGFLLANGKQRDLSWAFIGHKAKKILLPCALAGIVYYLFFIDFSFNHDPVNGTHLWYLPMIFVFYLLAPVVNSNDTKKFVLWTFVFVVGCILLKKWTNFRTFLECYMYLT